VLLASVDPLRLFVADPGDADLAGPLRDAVDGLVIDAVAAAYDALVRGARDHLVDRAAAFELLRFHARGGDDGTLELVSVALSPAIDDAVAAEVLARVGILPREVDTRDSFRRLVPGAASRPFLDACPWPRWSDVIGWNGAPHDDFAIEHVATSRITGGAVVLHHQTSARFHVLNDTAGYTWERTREGLSPGAVADAIASQFGLDADRARDDVWDALARWANEGWIVRAGVRVQVTPRDDGAARGRCLLSSSGATVALGRGAPARGDAIALVGWEPSGVAAIAAILALRHDARVVSDAPWIDEESGRAIPTASRLAVFETDDAQVAAVSPSFAAAARHVASNEVGFRWYEPAPWVGEPPIVGPVVVVRRASRGAPTTLHRLTVREGLLELVALGMRAEPPWSPERAHELLAWLEETPLWVLEARDVASGAEALQALEAEGP
jgi:hypothetical protein